ncbi:Acetoacetyl-CoA synthetase [Smittium mucronatum]|uniref:Acetoacetyl-CoA synthetase n=1 Tax=Smittium mucronatum TaxID=133383 RepID=A0A1R0GYS1_9FUNG|nr:Acetoacetyl-CoA synthetase [Smittium mucronatum]
MTESNLPSDSRLSVKPLWEPKNVEASELHKFIDYVNSKFNKNFENYFDLQKWSVVEIESFWDSIWEFTKIISHSPHSQVLEKNVQMSEIPKWFLGATINYAENVLERLKESNKIAIYARGEQFHSDISYRELYRKVSVVAHSFKKLGLEKGDRVAGYLTNCPEAIIAMLAAASMGAIWR